MPLKATSSDLNRVSKKEHHQEEGGLAQDVNAQAQVSIKVEGLTVKQRVGSDEKKTGAETLVKRGVGSSAVSAGSGAAFVEISVPTIFEKICKFREQFEE